MPVLVPLIMFRLALNLNKKKKRPLKERITVQCHSRSLHSNLADRILSTWRTSITPRASPPGHRHHHGMLQGPHLLVNTCSRPVPKHYTCAISAKMRWCFFAPQFT